jgi:SWI/SNF-related matrix-associated actin-dependent regulator of chromatin subfamily A member 5
VRLLQGLGKTLQSIALLASLKESGRARGPHLIIVPLSVLSQWMGEIAKWCPSLKALRYHGNKQERADLKREVADLAKGEEGDIKDYDCVVTTYEVATKEKTTLQRVSFDVLIVDEAHRLKNETSQLSLVCWSIRCVHPSRSRV